MPEPIKPEGLNRPLSSVPSEVANRHTAATKLEIPGDGVAPSIDVHPREDELLGQHRKRGSGSVLHGLTQAPQRILSALNNVMGGKKEE